MSNSKCVIKTCANNAEFIDEFGSLYCKECMLDEMKDEDLENMEDHIGEYFTPI